MKQKKGLKNYKIKKQTFSIIIKENYFFIKLLCFFLTGKSNHLWKFINKLFHFIKIYSKKSFKISRWLDFKAVPSERLLFCCFVVLLFYAFKPFYSLFFFQTFFFKPFYSNLFIHFFFFKPFFSNNLFQTIFFKQSFSNKRKAPNRGILKTK